MSSRGINYIAVILLVSCTNNIDTNKETINFKSKSISVVKEKNYNNVFEQLRDSVANWKLNNLRDYIEKKSEAIYSVDSLLCFNTNGDRLVSSLISTTFLKPNPTGGITIMLGEKINNQWFFFRGGRHLFIPYELKNNQDNNPFEVSELHQIALKEVYGGYLNSKGEINEAWFTSLFEGPGWGDFENQESSLKYLNTTEKFTDKRSFFEAIHLQSVKNNWASRDTTQPIVQLP